MDIRRRRRARPVAVLVVALFVVLAASEPGRASTFSVNRTQIFLTAKTRSEVLTVRNDSAGPVRLQLSVFGWEQGPRGEILLNPTRDIVFFPPLFSLAPGAKRSIRVGTSTPPGGTERTYRIFIEELPSSVSSPTPRPAEVRVLTRMGIPIFLQPSTQVAGPRIERTRLDRGLLSFDVRNTGNVHVVTKTVRITGLAASGKTVLEGALDGWYVLAGGTRAYALPLPAERCPEVTTVVVEVHTTQAVLIERLDATAAACGP
jgi:fimbrial chaperone protein